MAQIDPLTNRGINSIPADTPQQLIRLQQAETDAKLLKERIAKLDARLRAGLVPSTTSITLVNSWVPFGGAFLGPRGTLTGGEVVLEGMIGSGTNVTVGQLPMGMRPVGQLIFGVMTSGGMQRIDIDSAGNLFLTGGVPSWMSFSGVTFIAA